MQRPRDAKDPDADNPGCCGASKLKRQRPSRDEQKDANAAFALQDAVVEPLTGGERKHSNSDSAEQRTPRYRKPGRPSNSQQSVIVVQRRSAWLVG